MSYLRDPDGLLLDIRFALEDWGYEGAHDVYNTYSDLGWILSDVEVSSLTRKESYVSLPHANDVIDFSEYGGEAHYDPREIKYTFWQSFSNRKQMLIRTHTFEEMLMALSVNSRYDRIYDPTIEYNDDGWFYWARPRCVGFERRIQPLANVMEVTVTLRVYPIPQFQTLTS